MRIEVTLSHDGAHTTARAMEMDDLGAGSWAAGTLTPWGTLTMQITPLPTPAAEPVSASAPVELPAPDPLLEQAQAAGLVDETASAELNAEMTRQAEEAGASAPEPVVLLTRPQFEAPAPAAPAASEEPDASPAEPSAELAPSPEPEPSVEPESVEEPVETAPVETSTASGATKPSRR